MIENVDEHGTDNNNTTQPTRSDACTEHDRMIENLKSQLERRDQESRETKSEYQRATQRLTEELRTEAQRVSELRTQLQEMEDKSNKDSEEKQDLRKELQETRGNMSQTLQKNDVLLRDLKAQLDESSREKDSLRLQITRLEASALELDKSNADAQASGDQLKEQLRRQLHEQKEVNSTLQSQHSADILGLKERIGALEREHTDASAKHLSTVNEMESIIAAKDEQVQSLQLELAQHCLLQEASNKDRQELNEWKQKSTEQAQQDGEKVSKLESYLAEAKIQITELESKAAIASEKISSLEGEIMEARECIRVQAQAVEQEQDTRYDAEVAVMNQRVENAMAKEVSKKILEELNRANDRGKDMEEKMKTLEANIQSQRLGSTRLLLVTWEKVGEATFNKLYFMCYKEDALQCVRSLELCSKENCSRWDYISFGGRRIPSSMKQDEKALVEAWLQGGVMGRWPVADRAFFEETAQRADMPMRGDRPKLSLKRKTPHALPEGAESRVAKRGQTMGRIQEI